MLELEFLRDPFWVLCLFNVFVNDLPSVISHSEVCLYADDTTVYVANEDPAVVRDKLTEDLNAVADWIDRIWS